MKVLTIAHNAVAGSNRRRVEALRELPGIEVCLLTPRWWFEEGRRIDVPRSGAPVTAGTANLSWTPPSGADSYIVYRATASGGPYAAIASGQSIKSAFAQGKVAVENASISEADTPELFWPDDINPAKVILA